MTSSARITDIVVAGAGPVGLAIAAALKQAMGGRLKLVVIDPAREARDGRLRTVALSAGSRHLLQRIGAWGALEARAEPIREMAIFDGLEWDPARIEQLTFTADEGTALAHMAFNDDVADALAGA